MTYDTEKLLGRYSTEELLWMLIGVGMSIAVANGDIEKEARFAAMSILLKTEILRRTGNK